MKTLFLAAFLLLPSAQLQAAEPGNACAGDIQKFCKDAKPGPALTGCMKSHEAEVSQACKDQAAANLARFEHAKEAQNACGADIQKFCKASKPGPELDKCMKGHEAQLSEACKSMAAANRAKRIELGKAVHEACKGDEEKFCKGKNAPTGELGKCMHEHSKELSAGCTSALTKR